MPRPQLAAPASRASAEPARSDGARLPPPRRARHLSARGRPSPSAFTAVGGRPGGRLITPLRARRRPHHPGRPRLAAASPAAAGRPGGAAAGGRPSTSTASPAGAAIRARLDAAGRTTPAAAALVRLGHPGHGRGRLGLTLAPLVLVLERSDGPPGLPQGGAGHDRLPQQPSGLRASPGTASPLACSPSTSCSASPSPRATALRPIRITAAVTAVLIYALIVLGAAGPHHQFGPVLPRLAHLLRPLGTDCRPISRPCPTLGYSYVQVMLEWVHRLIAGVFVGPLVLLLAVLTSSPAPASTPTLAWCRSLLVVLLAGPGCARRAHRARPQQPLVGCDPSGQRAAGAHRDLAASSPAQPARPRPGHRPCGLLLGRCRLVSRRCSP